MNRSTSLRWILLTGILLPAIVLAGERTQSYPVQKGGTLQVHADAGDVVVKGWDKDEVFIRVTSLNDDLLKRVKISQGGGKVVIELDSDRNNMENVLFDIKVPSAFNADLRSGGGDLTLKAPLSGDLRGYTGGGSIFLGDLGGTIRMETAGGDIEAEDISGDLTLSTAGGDIKVKSIGGTGEISTAGGSVKIDAAARHLRVSTAGGDITIGKAKNADDQTASHGSADLSLSTAGGDITVGSAQGNIDISTAGGSISMASGRGRIKAKTSAGNVSLEKVQGSVNARTAAGNVAVTLDPAIGESSSMTTSAGNVLLRISEGARATVHARTHGPEMEFDEDEESDFIRSDFPVDSGGRRKAGQADVTLNGGGHTIKLETTMGMIEIRKAK